MKRRSFFTAGAVAVTGASCTSVKEQAIDNKLFSFIQFNDSHIQPERGAPEGLSQAIKKMNGMDVDFVIGNGDLVMDSLMVDEERALLQHDLFQSTITELNKPFHPVIGNHEVFGIYVPDKVPTSHPLWGKGLFKERYGDGRTYRSFDHNGAHLVLLDSIGYVEQVNKPGLAYIGEVGDEQLAWLESDLSKVDDTTPVIAFSHIPLFTLYSKIKQGPLFQFNKGTVINDGKKLYDLLMTKNFIGYMQGHIHVNELYQYKGTNFVDSGALSGGWWSGARDGHPEGFTLAHVYPDRVETEYITYGWDASPYKEKAQLDPDIFLV